MQSIDRHDALNSVLSGVSLNVEQTYSLFSEILRGNFSEIETTAFLIALKMKKESIGEIAGAAKAMTEMANSFPTPDYEFSDIVGTGGDGHDTINISSAASIVAASCGVKVAKHGNRSVSSRSGSSDLFSAFGVKLDMSSNTARHCLDKANLCFLAAPNYHSGMKYVMPIRTRLKTRTVFNILGPLANPARPTHHLLGVYTPELLDVYARILVSLGRNNAYVVHGSGLDEFAIHGMTNVFEVSEDGIDQYEVTPEDFGLPRFSLNEIKGGDPIENKQEIESVLAGNGKEAHTAAIAMNAGALLKLNKVGKTFKESTEMALESIANGKPKDTINQLATLSQHEIK